MSFHIYKPVEKLSVLLLLLGIVMMFQVSFAQSVIVNGVAGEDLDGLSPFETLQAAVDYSLVNSATDIEIHTDGPIAGAQIILATMPVPLTIRAAAGYIPSITSNLSFIPSNSDQQVTLEGLRVELPTGFDCPVWVGCNLTANNCVFQNIPGGGGYCAAMTACTGSPGTNATIILNNCYLRGHNGLQAGRSVRDYIVRDSTLVGQPSDLAAFYSVAVVHNMNWAQDWSIRLDANVGLDTISEPRTITLERSVLRGGTIMGWPMTTLPTSPYIENEVNTVGAIVATNCVFLYGDNIKVGHPGLPQPNALSAKFRHCTWRGPDYEQWGAMTLHDIPNEGIEIWNCLFDMPTTTYCIGTASPEINIIGDGNVYNVPDGEEFVDTTQPWAGPPDHWPSIGAPFELTKYSYTGIVYGDPAITAATGQLNYWSSVAIAEAVPLTPPVTDDIDGKSRPLPASAAAADVGAYEYDEGSIAGTEAWFEYR